MTETELVYAGLPRRLLAIFLDNVTWLCFYLFVYVYLVAVADAVSEVAGIVVVLAFFSLWLNYFAFSEWRWGQTIGKNATGIEVRSIDGEKLSFLRQTSVRNLLRVIDFFVVGWVMIARGKRRQRLGDKAAKTIVVRTPPKTIPGRPGTRVKAAAISGAAPPKPKAKPKPERRMPQIPWDASDAGWGLVAGLILAVVVTPFLVVPFDPDLSSNGALLAAQALLGGSLLLVALGMASQWKRASLGAAFGRLGLRRFRPSALGIALLTLFAYYVVVILFSALVLQPDQEDIGGELGIGDENLLIAVTAVLLIVVLAPFAEEMFFRGFVFAGLRTRWSLWPSALLAGGIFGLIHAPTGITTVVPLAALGIALCWLYDRTGSLWPCILAHFLNNALALAVTA